jgi:hypothetical protein
MTDYSAPCRTCGAICDWIDCPTGGWWSHRKHPGDEHDVFIGWRPMERIDSHGDWITS